MELEQMFLLADLTAQERGMQGTASVVDEEIYGAVKIRHSIGDALQVTAVGQVSSQHLTVDAVPTGELSCDLSQRGLTSGDQHKVTLIRREVPREREPDT